MSGDVQPPEGVQAEQMPPPPEPVVPVVEPEPEPELAAPVVVEVVEEVVPVVPVVVLPTGQTQAPFRSPQGNPSQSNESMQPGT